MVDLTLTNQVFKNINLTIDIKENSNVELNNTFSFNVNYNQENTTCVAVLKQQLTHKEGAEKFSILVEGIGQFVCEGIVSEETKKEAHVLAYNMLFPYVQNKIRDLAIDAGMPPLIIPITKMSVSDVQITGAK